MARFHLQITARGPKAAAKTAEAALDGREPLAGLAYSILEEDETRGLWRIDAYPATDEEADALMETLGAVGGLLVDRRPLADADWLALSLSGLPPLAVGRFFIHGAHDRGRVPASALALRIEAGAAFGTGHHGSTLGCLAAFDALLKRRRFGAVLDVGTGTGVLAIAAARAGARCVVGGDIDPVAIRIAKENAKLNRARARFATADGLRSPLAAAAAPFDLVFANILAGPLVRLAPEIRRALRPGGLAILSGILRSQERQVAGAYLARGFRLEARRRLDAWSTLTLQRR